MPRDHEIEICRALYAAKRRRGAPRVGLTRLGADYLLAETSDGTVRMEVVSKCCAWSAKAECAERWLAAREVLKS